MKKIILALAILAALTACNKENGKEYRVGKLEVKFELSTISTDILNYYNVSYKYTDFDGKKDSVAISGPKTVTFSVNNPNIGEESSHPFTVELLFELKDTTAKTSGTYDATLNYHLYHNGYYPDGSLITDSRSLITVESNGTLPTFDSFKSAVKSSSIKRITYKTFFCKTISGEWHIGAEGSKY